MSSTREISDKEMYEIGQISHDRVFTIFLGGILVALVVGLIAGPFVALKLFPNYFCLCG